MKQIYFLTSILFLTFINLNAQTVTITGSCNGVVDGNYELSTNVNNRPSYTNLFFIIQWTGNRWEGNPIGDSSLVGIYNDANTANPPASSFSPWIADLCNPAGIISGDGTSSSTLSVTEVELSNKKIKLFPNLTTDFIQISGLIKTEKYSISSIIGSEIKKGTISNNEKLDIQNLNNGLYFMRFENGNTIKFIKK